MGRNVMAWLGALLLALVACAGPARAGGFETQAELGSAPETIAATTATVDTSTPTTAIRPLACNGNPTLYVSALTATYACDVTIRVELYTGSVGSLTWIGTAYVGTVSFSASSGGVYYPSATAIASTSCKSATFADVRVTAISASGTTVTLKRWAGQADPRGSAP